MIRVGVVGANGYAGAELVRILAGHPEAALSIITSRQYAGKKFSDIYPAMAGVIDLVCEDMLLDRLCSAADLIFTALPHKVPMEIVPALIENGIKVVDLSADFRFSDIERYETYYQPHAAPDLLKQAVYGLSELYIDSIRPARLVGNPGCYPTSILLPLIPLIRESLIVENTIVSDSKSGVSGAGRSLSPTSHFCEVNESFKPYKVGEHRHAPEIEEVLEREAGVPIHITFVPHLVPMTRGMLTTTYVGLQEGVSEADIGQCFRSHFEAQPFIRLCPEGRMPNTLHVRGTNFCDIGFHVDKRSRRAVLVSAIDNLVKGASGQAVQNMNIMMGMDQATGLHQVPYPL
ncbi:MAG: N-acetyl-gamma-glutamyl-phosphate reductase [Desulfobacterales bacterium]